jgi:hypothetical protein
MTIKLDTSAGQHIRTVSEKAALLATDKGTDVQFEFNGTSVTVRPGESAEEIVARWDRDREAAHQAYINSDEYKQAEAKRAEEYRQRCAASMRELPFMIVKAEDALYPQCDPREKLAEALREWRPFLKEEAIKRLAESPDASRAVLAHWRYLAK